MSASAVRVAYGLVAVLSIGACKRAEPEQAAGPAAKPDKHARCVDIARQTAPAARMAAGGIAGALGGPEAVPSDAELTALTREVYDEMVRECMQWPDEVLDCFSAFAVFDSKCERVLAEWNGEVIVPKDVPAGPPVQWTHEFAGEPKVVRIDGDGRVLAIVKDENAGDPRLVALEHGEVRWSTSDAFAPTLAIDGAEVVAARRDELVAFETATGTTHWTVVLPAERGELGDEHPRVRVFAKQGERWIVLDAAGRSFAITPATCGPKKGCVRALGRLADEAIESDSTLLPAPQGAFVLRAETAIDRDGYRLLDSVRRFDREGNTTWQLVARETLHDAAVLDDGAVAVVVDGELVVLDASACASEGPFATSPWERKSPPRTWDEDECPECGAAPSGCIRGRWAVEGGAPPIAGPRGSVIVQDGFTRAFAIDGASWKTPTAGWGRARVTDDLVLVASIGGVEEGTLALAGLGHDGAHRFRSVLPQTTEALGFDTDDVHLDHAGRRVVVGLERAIAVLELPQSAAGAAGTP